MDRAAIEGRAEVVADFIRAFCRQDHNWWLKVPGLAFEADGRSGFSPLYYRAYHDGIWPVHLQGESNLNICVDLRSGELLHDIVGKPPSELGSAKDDNVLRLAFSLDLIDAKKVVERLETEAKQPICSFMNVLDRNKHLEYNRPHLDKFYRQVGSFK